MEFVNLFTQAGLEVVATMNANALSIAGVCVAVVCGLLWAKWALDIERRVSAHDWALEDLTEEQLRIKEQVDNHHRMLQHMAAMRAAKAEKAKVA
jgi:hypothetical protein